MTFLQLGAGARSVAAPGGMRVIKPGMLPAEELAALVASADLFLAPFIDGVSTRRTSFTAALCEGVAVVGTSGPLTDPMVLGAQLELVEVGSALQFAERVAEVAADPARREAAARGWARVVRGRARLGRDRVSLPRRPALSVKPLRVMVVSPWAERDGGAEEILWMTLRRLDRARLEPEVGFLFNGSLEREVSSLGNWDLVDRPEAAP